MFAHLRRPNFERLRTTLFNGRADRVPLIELGIHPRIKAAVLGHAPAGVADEIAFMGSMGYDYIKIQPLYTFEQERQRRRGGTPQRDTNSIDRKWATEGEGIVRTWAEFEAYDWPRRQDVSYRAFEEAARLLPDGMKVIGQYGDIFTSAWETMGFEAFSEAMVEEPELVDAILDKIADVVVSMFETMVDFDVVGALWYSDDVAYTSSLIISPVWLRAKLFPHMARIGELARRRNIPFIYHSDGALWDVFDDIIGCGVTAQHPIEPLAMDIFEVKRRVGDHLCLCGNIDVDMLSRGPASAVEARVRELFAGLGEGGGWCLGSGNSVPDYALLDNYLAMVRTALELDQ